MSCWCISNAHDYPLLHLWLNTVPDTVTAIFIQLDNNIQSGVTEIVPPDRDILLESAAASRAANTRGSPTSSKRSIEPHLRRCNPVSAEPFRIPVRRHMHTDPICTHMRHEEQCLSFSLAVTPIPKSRRIEGTLSFAVLEQRN